MLRVYDNGLKMQNYNACVEDVLKLLTFKYLNKVVAAVLFTKFNTLIFMVQDYISQYNYCSGRMSYVVKQRLKFIKTIATLVNGIEK